MKSECVFSEIFECYIIQKFALKSSKKFDYDKKAPT